MKPQFITQELGVHSKELKKTIGRLTKGSSWKKTRTVIIVPAADLIPAKVAFAMWNLMFPPNNMIFKVLALGQEVGAAYSDAIEGILASPDLMGWEYILTIEHDNIPPPDGFLKLLDRMEQHPELSCISGLYFTKGEGGVAQIWGDINDPVMNFRPQVPILGALQECYGVGMGFALFRMDMFKNPKLRKPWFKTTSGSEGQATQDLYAWTDFRKYGYRCAVDNDVKVGHYDVNTDIVW